MEDFEAGRNPNYIELLGLSPEEQNILSCDNPDDQVAINQSLRLLSDNLKQEVLADVVHKPSKKFDCLSIVESLAKDPKYVLEVLSLSFDQSVSS